jgi:hypothetical protein
VVNIIEVDGERFIVEQAPGDTHQLNFTWLTGRHPGYGFSSGTQRWSAPETADPEPDPRDKADSAERLEQSIRNFLAQINPATGYID